MGDKNIKIINNLKQENKYLKEKLDEIISNNNDDSIMQIAEVAKFDAEKIIEKTINISFEFSKDIEKMIIELKTNPKNYQKTINAFISKNKKFIVQDENEKKLKIKDITDTILEKI